MDAIDSSELKAVLDKLIELHMDWTIDGDSLRTYWTGVKDDYSCEWIIESDGYGTPFGYHISVDRNTHRFYEAHCREGDEGFGLMGAFREGFYEQFQEKHDRVQELQRQNGDPILKQFLRD
jgi:hypothetical protein